MAPHDTIALLAAGVLAGLVGSAGGITSLVSYPVLLAVGLPALAASVTNNVALVACWPGSALASRPELTGRAAWVRRFTLLTAAGGGAGAALLLVTPPDAFRRIVPFLVLAGSLALLMEPRLTARRARQAHPARRQSAWLPLGLLVVSVYNGYFGAGSGVMTLTLVLVLAEPQLPRANALKNMLIGAASLLAAAVFVIDGSPDWSAAVPLALGMFAGSNLGPRAARRLPAALLRLTIVLLGAALAAAMWLGLL